MIRAGTSPAVAHPRGAPSSGGLIRDRDGRPPAFPEHPYVTAGYVRRGRLAMEEAIGRVRRAPGLWGTSGQRTTTASRPRLYESSSHLRATNSKECPGAGDISNPSAVAGQTFRALRCAGAAGRTSVAVTLDHPGHHGALTGQVIGSGTVRARHPVSQAGTEPSGGSREPAGLAPAPPPLRMPLEHPTTPVCSRNRQTRG
jgi:hypothetical protein